MTVKNFRVDTEDRSGAEFLASCYWSLKYRIIWVLNSHILCVKTKLSLVPKRFYALFH